MRQEHLISSWIAISLLFHVAS